MWDVESLSTSCQGWHHMQEESDLLQAAVQYFMDVAIYLLYCIVLNFKLKVKDYLLLSTQCPVLTNTQRVLFSLNYTMHAVVGVNSIY